MLDGLGQVHVARVDEGDALGSGEELRDGGVVAVAAQHLVAQGGGVHVLACGLKVERPAGQARLLAGGDEQAHVGVGHDDGGDVTALGDDARATGEGGSAAPGLGVDDLALEAGHLRTHVEVRGHRGDDGGDMRLTDGLGDVDTVAHDAGGLGVQAHVQRHRLDGAGVDLAGAQVDAGALAPPGGGAVHGTRVEVGQTQLGGDAHGDGGLTRSARSVDGDDNSHGQPPGGHPRAGCGDDPRLSLP